MSEVDIEAQKSYAVQMRANAAECIARAEAIEASLDQPDVKGVLDALEAARVLEAEVEVKI